MGHRAKIKKSPGILAPGDFFGLSCQELLLRVSFVEFLHSASSVKKHLLACVEWMRLRAYFDFVNWISLAVSPLDSFASLDG